MNIEFAYVPYVRIPKFLEGKQGDMGTFMEWNVYKKISSQTYFKQPTIKNHFEYT